MVFNPEQRYISARSPVAADNLVATSQPLATEAGLQALRNGGNALDAALAAAITLTVVEPNNNGLGSDAFALLWDGQQVVGLNASGRAPAAWFLDRFAGRKRMPELGWDSVTVPGVVPKLMGSPGQVRWAGRPQGADTQAVLAEYLGMDGAAIGDLESQGVIGCGGEDNA